MKKGLRQGIFFAVLLGVPVGAWAYVFHPRNVEITAARQDVELKLTQLNELRQVESINNGLEETLEVLHGALEDLRSRIPDAAGVEDMLRRIGEITSEHQLKVRSFKRERTVTEARYDEIPIKTIIEGPFKGIHQFLADLERMPRIMRILTMKIDRPQYGVRGAGDLDEGAVRAEISFRIYAQPDPAQLEKELTGR